MPRTTRSRAIPARALGIALLFSLLLGSHSSARAAGLFVPGRGVLPMGRAGASIAGADSLQALWYNPANLAAFHGFSILVDVGIIQNTTRFQRAPRLGAEGKEIAYEPVQTAPHVLPDPSLLFAYGWKKHRVTIAGGIYAPYASPSSYPDTGAQRYAVVDLTGSLFAIAHLAVAWAPHPRFRVGAGIQNHTAVVRLLSAASGYLGVFGAPEDQNLDLYTEARISAPFNISGNVGVWGRILDFPNVKWDIAASVQLPVYLQGHGQVSIRLPTHPLFDPTTVDGDQIKTSFFLPVIARGATRLTLFDRADLEFAFVYEGWSVLDELRLEIAEPNGLWIRNVPTIGDYKVPGIVIPSQYRDAYSLRFGASVKVLPRWLQVRLGYAYEIGAPPDKTVSVFFYDADKHMMSVGVSITFLKMAIDISYAHILLPTREVTQSEKKQINPLNPSGAVVVGNGIYDSSYNIVGVAWRGSF